MGKVSLPCGVEAAISAGSSLCNQPRYLFLRVKEWFPPIVFYPRAHCSGMAVIVGDSKSKLELC